MERVSDTFTIIVLLTRYPEQFAGWTQGTVLFVGPLPAGQYVVQTTIYLDSLQTEWHPDPTCEPLTYPQEHVIEVSELPPDFPKAPVIEFYNAQLDHYFITQSESEIAALDRGIYRGWPRTGHAFLGYKSRNPTGPGVTGSHGYHVCRLYGLPSAGLDTHFHSIDQLECGWVLSRYPGKWVLEDSAAFEMPRFNKATGDCPPNTIPVYRAWNGRFDSNHRYTTDRTTRDAMVASGYIAEGYGPDAVVMCAPER